MIIYDLGVFVGVSSEQATLFDGRHACDDSELDGGRQSFTTSGRVDTGEDANIIRVETDGW